MSATKPLVVILAVAAAVAGGTAHAQEDDERVFLDADVFRTPSGPTVRFIEEGGHPERNAPVIGRMEIIRPSRVLVRRPPTGKGLGQLEFFVGPGICPTCEDRRVLKLRRVRSLGDGYYLLAEGFGARVVLSTRFRTRFLTVSLPEGSRNVSVSLKGAGARLLAFNCSQRSPFVFEGRFTQPTDVDRHTPQISRMRVNRAGLCGLTETRPVS